MSVAHNIEEFCVAIGPRLVAALERLGADRSTAQDLSQEALARAWLRWDRVGSLERPDAWTYRVALNLLRSKQRRSRLETRLRGRFADVEHDAPDPYVVAEVGQLDCVSGLSAHERRVLVLQFVEGARLDEIAQILGRPIGSVKSTSSRARAKARLGLRSK
jgi:RNA polymerase sigma factor (sigma-70 family)